MFFERKERKNLLDQALADWRDAGIPAESLSSEARRAVLSRSLEHPEEQSEGALAELFLPVRRLALAGALPVLLLTVALGYVLAPAPRPIPPAVDQPVVQAMRVGNEVVFEIANGGKIHNIYKSNRPNDLGTGEPFATTLGSFRDRVDGEGGLVFYRID